MFRKILSLPLFPRSLRYTVCKMPYFYHWLVCRSRLRTASLAFERLPERYWTPPRILLSTGPIFLRSRCLFQLAALAKQPRVSRCKILHVVVWSCFSLVSEPFRWRGTCLNPARPTKRCCNKERGHRNRNASVARRHMGLGQQIVNGDGYWLFAPVPAIAPLATTLTAITAITQRCLVDNSSNDAPSGNKHWAAVRAESPGKFVGGTLNKKQTLSELDNWSSLGLI